MCGRYTLSGPDSIGERFEADFVDFHETRILPRFNIAPSQQVPVVVTRSSERVVLPMIWGFQPSWMREPKRPPPINARAEGLAERPMFRTAVARGRCIIAADGFYEWVAVPGRKTKQPVYIRLKTGELFGFAGLHTASPNGEPTCVIITTSANDLIEPIHDRMPVILHRDDEAVWLDPTIADPQMVVPLLRSLESEVMETYPVATLVSSPANDGPELIRPLR